MQPILAWQPRLKADEVVVVFDGTPKAPMGRYLSDWLDPAAVDVGAAVPVKKRTPLVFGRNRVIDDGPEAA